MEELEYEVSWWPALGASPRASVCGPAQAWLPNPQAAGPRGPFPRLAEGLKGQIGPSWGGRG